MEHILIRKKAAGLSGGFPALLRRTPVIPSVKSPEDLERCLSLEGGIIFSFLGDILTIPGLIARIKAAGKLPMVYVDLIEGLSGRDPAVDFLAKAGAGGILSIKPNLIKRAKVLGLLTIQRFFVLDSISLVNIEKQLPLEYADAIEVIPGVIPKTIRRLAGIVGKPIIAGGLVADREDVEAALAAGAVSVSSSNIALV
ncbi:MAG: glycerol-3-phosphate responsive antiterminator [Treponema sp.]|jgi:glycerol uptake operon antiterminator|nr:glycerol-3-phosphate responsive antiterminator [Treponema sp.]